MRLLSYPNVVTNFDIHTVLHMCKSVTLFSYIILTGIVVSLANPISRIELSDFIGWSQFTFLSSLSFIIFFSIFSIFNVAVLAAQHKEDIKVFPLISASAIFTQFAADLIGRYTTSYKGASIFTLLGSIALIVPICTLTSIIYFKYVHSFVMRNYKEPEFAPDYIKSQTVGRTELEETNSAQESKFFIISGKKYPIAGLLHIRAERNYIKINWENGSAFLRARLSDVSEQLDNSVGIQVHRSFWLARIGIARVLRSGPNLNLITSDNLEVHVARHRKVDVEEWLRRHGFLY